MKNKKVDAERVWKQVDDDVVPQLRLCVIDRAVYSYLLRHSRLEGRPRVRFTVAWLANGTRLCTGTTRKSLHRLFDKGALRLVECAKSGHVVHVRLPEEIRGVQAGKIAAPSRSCPLRSWRRRTSIKTGRCGDLFTTAKAAGVFIACGGLNGSKGASTTWCRAQSWGEIRTETWFPAVMSAI